MAENTVSKTLTVTLEEVKMAYMVFLQMSMVKLPLKTIFAIKKILLALESDVNKANETGEELKKKYTKEIEDANTKGKDALKEVEDRINAEYVDFLRGEKVDITFKPLAASAIEEIELSLPSANCIERFLDMEA